MSCLSFKDKKIQVVVEPHTHNFLFMSFRETGILLYVVVTLWE